MDDELELDIGAAVDDIGGGLGFLSEDPKENPNPATGADPNPAAAATPTEGGDPAQTAAAAATPADTPAAQDPTAEPPKTWRKEAAAVWAALPAEAKTEILKREEDIFKGIEGYKADAGFGKSVKTALAPYMPTLQQYNIDPVAQVQALLHAHHTLALGKPEEKLALFQKLATDYQIDLGQLGASGEPPYVDPAVKALQTELQSVKSQLSAGERARQLEAQKTLEKQIDAFAADPANTHFQDVANDMAVLLEKGVCKTLQEAYDRAVWMNPAIRAKEIARQQAAASKKAAEEAAAKAAAAKKATAANVRTSAKSGSAAAPLGSIDDTLAETLASIKARG